MYERDSYHLDSHHWETQPSDDNMNYAHGAGVIVLAVMTNEIEFLN